jgi:hypothetical protein
MVNCEMEVSRRCVALCFKCVDLVASLIVGRVWPCPWRCNRYQDHGNAYGTPIGRNGYKDCRYARLQSLNPRSTYVPASRHGFQAASVTDTLRTVVPIG